MLSAGQRLRALREELGLTIRDVEAASTRISHKHGNEDFAISLSRLSDIETKGILPNIYRLYSLAVIYRRDLRELLSWFGVDTANMAADLAVVEPPKSHIAEALGSTMAINIPVRLDPAFDLRRTVNLGRMIERWGLIPLAYLSQFAGTKYAYGYIGSQDFTMFPILLPGSFIQIDESCNQVAEGSWRSEYERPIYFVETREGHTCCWCALKGEVLVLQPHPLSPVPVRMLKHPQDAEVVGQVVGVAMHLQEWRPGNSSPTTKGPRRLN